MTEVAGICEESSVRPASDVRLLFSPSLFVKSPLVTSSDDKRHRVQAFPVSQPLRN